MFRLSRVSFNKGDLDAQPEPEPGPAEPEPGPAEPKAGPEAGSAAAGRRPEARSAAAGSEPAGPESRPAGQGRSLARAQNLSKSRQVPPKGGAFLLAILFRHRAIRMRPLPQLR